MIPIRKHKLHGVYVASSWRNEHQPGVVKTLRDAGITAYDFKDEEGFHWSDVDPRYNEALQAVSAYSAKEEFDRYQAGLEHPRAQQGYERDFTAMDASEGCVLVLPSGRSAHLEAGWFLGRARPMIIYVPEFDGTWELMYKMADAVTDDLRTVLAWAGAMWEL